jgi:hypothetical protein
VDVAVGSNQRQVLEVFADGRTVTIDFQDLEKGVREVCAYARDYPLSAVLGVDEETTVLASRASKALEPIQEVVESEESDVIHCRAPESKRGGARCGRLNIAAQRTVAVCDIPAI